MKLASLKYGRDGRLVLVSSDLKKYFDVSDVVPTLQAALDDWETYEPVLHSIYKEMENGQHELVDFVDTSCTSPLPRTYQWADGSAYVNHVELVRKARGADMPASFWTDPLMYQGGSDNFIGPKDAIEMEDEKWGIDFEAEIAIITDDVPMGVDVDEAASHIKLIMLVNDVSLRNLIPAELGKGFGFFHSKPSSAFSPVAITLDELEDYWKDDKLHLPLTVHLNNEKFGNPNAGVDMVFNFSQLIAHAAKTRPLCAGTIIGSGTVSNVDRSNGSCCLAEKRMLEIIEKGEATTPFMKFGDVVRIEMFDNDNKSLFGTIEQKVEKYIP